MTINFRGSTVKTYDFCAILGVNDFLGSMTLSRWFRVYGSGSMVLGRLFGSMVLGRWFGSMVMGRGSRHVLPIDRF
jgi:hypothetical protein